MAKTSNKENAIVKTKRSRQIGPQRNLKALETCKGQKRSYYIARQALLFGIAMGVVVNHGMYYELINKDMLPRPKKEQKTHTANRKTKPRQVFKARQGKRALDMVRRALQYGIANGVVIRKGQFYRLVSPEKKVNTTFPDKHPQPVISEKCNNNNRPISNDLECNSD